MNSNRMSALSIASLIGTVLSAAVLVSTFIVSYTHIPLYTWLLQFASIGTLFFALITLDKAVAGKGLLGKLKSIYKSSRYSRLIFISLIILIIGALAVNIFIYFSLHAYIQKEDSAVDIEEKFAFVNTIGLRAYSLIWITLYYASLAISIFSEKKS